VIRGNLEKCTVPAHETNKSPRQDPALIGGRPTELPTKVESIVTVVVPYSFGALAKCNFDTASMWTVGVVK